MNTASEKSMGRMKDPVIQALLVLAAVLAINLAAIFAKAAGMDVEQRFPWTVAASLLLFFAAGNAIMSLMAGNMDRYWSRSILSFMGLALAAGTMAYLFSKLTMSQAGSYRWIYIVLTIGYLVFLSMITFMKKIVEFAQREEWNQPRIRSRR